MKLPRAIADALLCIAVLYAANATAFAPYVSGTWQPRGGLPWADASFSDSVSLSANSGTITDASGALKGVATFAASYGSLAASARAEVGPGPADLVGNSAMSTTSGFTDLVRVTSTTLPVGTGVMLR